MNERVFAFSVADSHPFHGMMQVKNGKIMAIMSSEIKLEHEEEKCCCDLKEKNCNKVFPATSFGAHQTK